MPKTKNLGLQNDILMILEVIEAILIIVKRNQKG